jgi:hypothetical protein
MVSKQVKKNTQKSEIQFRPGTQERATQLNNGGATQIVLNRKGRRYGPIRKGTKKKE